MMASTVTERGTAAHRPPFASEDVGTRDFPADLPRAGHVAATRLATNKFYYRDYYSHTAADQNP